jgi:hypothetical protein
MNITSGGLTIAVMAAIWFLVFLPSFIKADSNNFAREKVETNSRDLLSSKLGEKASRAIRARKGRAVLGTLSVGALVVATLSILEFATVGTGLSLAVGAAVSCIVFVSLTIRNHRKYQTLVQDAVHRKITYTRPSLEVQAQKMESNSSRWQPVEVPKQAFLKTGAIDIVDLAEVVEMEPRAETSEVESLDEILRRRRHIG